MEHSHFQQKQTGITHNPARNVTINSTYTVQQVSTLRPSTSSESWLHGGRHVKMSPGSVSCAE